MSYPAATDCAHCSTADFLPLRCKACKLLFCADHVKFAAHSCTTTRPGLDRTTGTTGTAEGEESVKSIFEAVEHRHDAIFDDSAATLNGRLSTSKVTDTATAEAQTRAAGDVNSIKSLEKLNRIAVGSGAGSSSSSSSRQSSIARKTKDLLLRGKALGMQSSIPAEDKFYFIATFGAFGSDESTHADRKCLFVNKKTTTVGELCEWAGKALAFPCFKRVMRPDGMTVYFSSAAAMSTAASSSSSCASVGEKELGGATGSDGQTGEEGGQAEAEVRADYDRTALVSSVLSSMQVVTFHAISSAAAATAQVAIVAQLEAEAAAAAMAAEQLQQERQAVLAAEAEKAAKATEIDEEKLAIGDMVVYQKGDIIQLAKVTGKHLDDYPNLYFTISYSNCDGPGERQTTTRYLRYPQSETVSSDAGGFGINIIHGGKTHRIPGIGPLMQIAGLKLLVTTATGLAAKNQKLICKGKVLADRDLVKDTKLSAGCKVTLMGKKG